jgi:hypothetical protein
MNQDLIINLKMEYPNEWVLLKYANTDEIQDGIADVLLHSKDYLELCYKGSELQGNFIKKIYYTGEKSNNRKWLKLSRL